MNKFLRILSLLLVSAMLLPACAQDMQTAEDTTAPVIADMTASEEETTLDPNDRSRVKDNLPDDLDFGGETVNVLYRGSDDGKSFIERFDVRGTDNLGDYVSDAVWERNRSVEERLGITLNIIPSGVDTPDEVKPFIMQIVMSGTDDYDYIHTTGNTNVIAGLNPYLRDLADAPYIDYDQPWWWSDVIKAVSLDGKTFNYIFGDMMVFCYVQTGVIYYNKTLYEDIYGDPDEVYSFVMDGTWTVDKLAELTAAAYKDANGNGIEDVGDVFGMLKTQNQGEETPHFVQGCGIEMYHYDENDNMIIEFDQERAVSAIDKLGALYNNTVGVFHSDLTIDPSDKYFAEGSVLFYPARFARACSENLRNMDSPYGIVPYPKLDEEQSQYYSLIHDSSTNLSVPKTTSDEKMKVVGATFEALCAESYRSVMPLFLETALKLKYSHDTMSGQVIDIVIASVSKNPLHEYGTFTNKIIDTCLYSNIKSGKNTFSSAYAKALSVAQKTWDKATAKLHS